MLYRTNSGTQVPFDLTDIFFQLFTRSRQIETDNGIVFLDPETQGNVLTKIRKCFPKYRKIEKIGQKNHKSAFSCEKSADFADFKTFITFDFIV